MEDCARETRRQWYRTDSVPASEPVAAVGYPPANDADRNGGQYGPHDWQGEVGYQPKRNEGGPEDFALHSFILTR
jgi:hypothetical protein